MNKFSTTVEAIDQELEFKTGIFLNPKTGNAWELHIENGKLLIEVPNFSFEIYPSSLTRFKPVDTNINLEIEFEKQSNPKFLFMHIYTKGIRRATFLLF